MPTTPSQQDRRIEAEFVTLRDYIDTRLEALEKEREAAYKAMDKRLDGMNEFRDALKDQNSTFVLKAEYCLFKTVVDADIRSLRESRAELAGKASQMSVNITLAIAIIGLLISVWSKVSP